MNPVGVARFNIFWVIDNTLNNAISVLSVRLVIDFDDKTAHQVVRSFVRSIYRDCRSTQLSLVTYSACLNLTVTSRAHSPYNADTRSQLLSACAIEPFTFLYEYNLSKKKTCTQTIQWCNMPCANVQMRNRHCRLLVIVYIRPSMITWLVSICERDTTSCVHSVRTVHANTAMDLSPITTASYKRHHIHASVLRCCCCLLLSLATHSAHGNQLIVLLINPSYYSVIVKRIIDVAVYMTTPWRCL